MGNCICSPLTFCLPCLGGNAPIAPACTEPRDDIAPRLSKDQHSPVQRPDQQSLPMQLDHMWEQGGVYYLPPPPAEPCSPPVARRSEKGQSVKVLVSKQQLELLIQNAKKEQFNEIVTQFMTELKADEETNTMFQKWKPDLPTIPE